MPKTTLALRAAGGRAPRAISRIVPCIDPTFIRSFTIFMTSALLCSAPATLTMAARRREAVRQLPAGPGQREARACRLAHRRKLAGRTQLVLECHLHVCHVRLLGVKPRDGLVAVHDLAGDHLQCEMDPVKKEPPPSTQRSDAFAATPSALKVRNAAGANLRKNRTRECTSRL